MIKINLAPVDELESPVWYVPDVALILVVALAGFLGVKFYLGSVRAEIDSLTTSRDSFRKSYTQLAPDLEKFKSLDANIKTLRNKLDSLKDITISKVARYKPIIVLEHLQNLKPDGVWFWSVKIIGNANKVQIYGQTYDNLLLAEFLSSLQATATDVSDPNDLRSQVYFTDVRLEQSEVVESGKQGFLDLRRYPEFRINLTFLERGQPVPTETAPDGKTPPAKPLSENETESQETQPL